ncbi:MAG: V-type ATP synthase subunit A [Parachlamydiales bacterium]
MNAKGKVASAFGNLLEVEFEGAVKQGEIGMVEVGNLHLKAEVIEVAGSRVKIQVFEDTRGVGVGTPVAFQGTLLEAELGPGLLTAIVDGLQNPLPQIANESGLFLPRGVYLPTLDRKRHWDYTPVAKVGQRLKRGDTIGTCLEGRFTHRIMIPFAIRDEITLIWVNKGGHYTVETVVAKGTDSKGREHEFTMIQRWPIKRPMREGERVVPTKMLKTGMRIIDTQFPLLQGGTFCTPGPFGAGKTVLQHHLAKYSDIDIVVVCACGERAGEVVEVVREFPHLTDPHTGEALINRTVIICNTSSMPVAARESSVYLGITIAEYYRQMGLNILLLADSTSRWAQALREMSGRLEEIPGEEAFPAYLASRIAEFYERAGVLDLGDGRKGSVTIGGAVSPAGGNFEEPVTQATLAVVGAFLGLSRGRSDARRYPSIDPLISWSKYAPAVGRQLDAETKGSGWYERVVRAGRLLHTGDEIGKRMEVVGEEGTAIDDLVVYLKAELFDFCFLQQNAFDKEDRYCPLQRQVPLFALINEVFDAKFHFENHEEARGFFVHLQSQIKNLNFLPFKSDEQRRLHSEIEKKVRNAPKQEAAA